MLKEFYFSIYLSQCLSKGKKKVKIVPLDLSLLTPLALAHLVMQKGLLYNNSLHICTDGFVYANIQRLTQYLMHRFNIKCTIHIKAGGNFHIYILAKYVDLVKNLILPFELKIIYATAFGSSVYPPTFGFPPFYYYNNKNKKKGKQGQKEHKFDNNVLFRSPFFT